MWYSRARILNVEVASFKLSHHFIKIKSYIHKTMNVSCRASDCICTQSACTIFEAKITNSKILNGQTVETTICMCHLNVSQSNLILKKISNNNSNSSSSSASVNVEKMKSSLVEFIRQKQNSAHRDDLERLARDYQAMEKRYEVKQINYSNQILHLRKKLKDLMAMIKQCPELLQMKRKAEIEKVQANGKRVSKQEQAKATLPPAPLLNPQLTKMNTYVRPTQPVPSQAISSKSLQSLQSNGSTSLHVNGISSLQLPHPVILSLTNKPTLSSPTNTCQVKPQAFIALLATPTQTATDKNYTQDNRRQVNAKTNANNTHSIMPSTSSASKIVDLCDDDDDISCLEVSTDTIIGKHKISIKSEESENFRCVIHPLKPPVIVNHSECDQLKPPHIMIELQKGEPNVFLIKLITPRNLLKTPSATGKSPTGYKLYQFREQLSPEILMPKQWKLLAEAPLKSLTDIHVKIKNLQDDSRYHFIAVSVDDQQHHSPWKSSQCTNFLRTLTDANKS